jgi:hypothetical protein
MCNNHLLCPRYNLKEFAVTWSRCSLDGLSVGTLGENVKKKNMDQRKKLSAQTDLLLATSTNDDVLEPPVVLKTTLSTAPNTLGLVRLLGNLGGLATHLSGTRK